MPGHLYPGVGYGLMLVQSVYTVGVHILLMFCRGSIQHYNYCTGSVTSKRVFCIWRLYMCTCYSTFCAICRMLHSYDQYLCNILLHCMVPSVIGYMCNDPKVSEVLSHNRTLIR